MDPLSAALSASLEPGRGSDIGAALSRPRCGGSPPAGCKGRSPGPDSCGWRRHWDRKARGRLQDAMAIVRTAGAGGLQWGPAGCRRSAQPQARPEAERKRK